MIDPARLPISGWEKVRDGLTDLWDWWADGAHLRPQLKRARRSHNVERKDPYVLDMIRVSTQIDTDGGSVLPQPVRTATADAHLGEGLFN
jgi:hypothetical protein